MKILKIKLKDLKSLKVTKTTLEVKYQEESQDEATKNIILRNSKKKK